MNIQTRAMNRAATFRKKNPVASRFIAMAKKKEKVQKNFEDSLVAPQFIAAVKNSMNIFQTRAMNRAATFLKKKSRGAAIYRGEQLPGIILFSAR